MAMEPCPNCKKRISTAADVCPKCGHKLNADQWKEEREKSQKTVGYLLLATALIIGGTSMLSIVSVLNDSVVGKSLRGGSFRVTVAESGADWPFKEQTEAVVSCKTAKVGRRTRPMVTISLEGVTYGLNGAAVGVGGYRDPDSLRKTDKWGQRTIGASVISDWIKRAIARC